MEPLEFDYLKKFEPQLYDAMLENEKLKIQLEVLRSERDRLRVQVRDYQLGFQKSS